MLYGFLLVSAGRLLGTPKGHQMTSASVFCRGIPSSALLSGHLYGIYLSNFSLMCSCGPLVCSSNIGFRGKFFGSSLGYRRPDFRA